MAFVIKRVYEPAELDLWDKEVAPSPELRTEWHHAADRQGDFDHFAGRYRAELDESPAAAALLALGPEHDRVTLLYGARDEQTNHAAVLLAWLGEHGAEVEGR